MSSSNIILCCAGLYLLVLLGIGFWAKKKADKADDFLVASGQVGLIMCICTIAAVNIGSGVVVGGATSGMNLGLWPGMYYSMSCGVGCIVAGLFFASKMRNAGCVVPLDFFEKRFGPNRFARILATITNVPNLVGIYVAQLLACGSILAAFGIPFSWGVIACAAVIIIYSSMGGMLSVVVGDLVQLIILGIGVPLAAIFALKEMTAVTGITAGEVFGSPFIPDLGDFIYYIVPFLLSLAVSYDCFMRYQSAKNAQVAKWGCVGGGILCMFIGTMASAVGVAGHALYPEVTDGIFAYTVAQTCPTFIAAIVVTAVLAAAMSSGNCLLIGTAGCVTKDFYRSVLHPDKELSELPKANLINRGTVIVAGILGILITFFMTNILDAIISSTYPYTGAMLVSLVCAVYYKGATMKGIYATMVLGFIGGCFLYVCAMVPSIPAALGLNLDWGLFSLYIFNFLVVFIVSSLDKKGEKFPMVEITA